MATPLVQLKEGQKAVIEDLAGELSFITRATAIGFCPGVELTSIRNNKHHPMIVFLNDTLVAIDRNEAQKVMVDECP